MKEKKFSRKFSLIILMLVVTLTTFYYAPKKVFADSRIDSITINGGEYVLDDFDKDVLEYNLEISETELYLDFSIETVDEDSDITIDGNKYMPNPTGTITIESTLNATDNTTYLIHYSKTKLIKTFGFINSFKKYRAPFNTKYKIELWGAAGSEAENGYSNFGGYTKGLLNLKTGENIYVYVGEKGNQTRTMKFNGGGYGGTAGSIPGNSGGGATDVRLVSGNWDDFDSLKSRIMVAAGAGGSGAGVYDNAGEKSTAGGLTGYSGGYYPGHNYVNQNGKGGTQTAGGAAGNNHFSASGSTYAGTFGAGGKSENYSDGQGSGGGGGGYFGGGAGGGTRSGGSGQGGGGGSSFISGHKGCIAIKESSTSNSIVPIGTEIHYSKKVFTETEMIDGKGYKWTTTKSSTYSGMPTFDGTDTMIGNKSDGYAKITPILLDNDNFLSSLSSNKGILSPSFDMLTQDYTLELDGYTRYFEINGTLSSNKSNSIGLNEKNEIDAGQTKLITIYVISESGKIRSYSINVHRADYPESDHSSKLEKLSIKEYEDELDPAFDSDTNNYSITVLRNEIGLNIEYKTYDSEATVEINGNYLENDSGTITITVHEPHVVDTVYTISYVKDLNNSVSEDVSYNGSYQKYVIPKTGIYKIELWGAQGRYTNDTLAYGAYTSGEISLTKGETLYFYVGERGKASNYNALGTQLCEYCQEGSFNGGGAPAGSNTGGGGGATDVRIFDNDPTEEDLQWNSTLGLKNRLMVAGAGGGYGGGNGTPGSPGNAGGLTGYNGTTGSCNHSGWCGYGYGGTQISGGTGGSGAYAGTFGEGAKGGLGGYYTSTYLYPWPGGAGGGGYYGGGSGQGDAYGGSQSGGGGAGGSSYISGHIGSVAVDENSSPKTNCETGTTDINCSIHYSGKYFKNTKMIDGSGYSWTNVKNSLEQMPTPSGSVYSSGKGHIGNGYARITQVLLDKNNYLSSLSSDYGTISPEFNKDTSDYNLTLSKYENRFTLSGELVSDTSYVIGLNREYKISNGETKIVDITVISEDGSIRIYNVRATRGTFNSNEHSSKLERLDVAKHVDELNPKFDYSINDYEVEINENEIDLEIEAIPYDEDAEITITGNKYIKPDTGVVTITVSAPECEDTIYTITYNKSIDAFIPTILDYTGSYQVFVAPKTTKYKVELWGAQGGQYDATRFGAYGAYTYGEIDLKKGTKLYVYVGEEGKVTNYNALGTQSCEYCQEGSFNGGGIPAGSNATGGGGATDVRYFEYEPTEANLQWNSELGLRSRIMVAGAGGGYGGGNKTPGSPGAGGGLISYNGTTESCNHSGWCDYGRGATQTSGGLGGSGGYAGTFGIGAKGGLGGYHQSSYPYPWPGGAGGGGYYGGGSGQGDNGSGGAYSGGGGAGGSSYISGHTGSVAVTSIANSNPKSGCVTGTTNIECSYHYSDIIFDNTKMIDGNGYEWTNEVGSEVVGMPTHDGTDTMTGNSGNGYAKITALYETRSLDNYLSNLLTDKGTWNKSFEPTEEEYTVNLGVDDTSINIAARPSSDLAVIDGLGEYDVPAGETEVPITVTAESGDIRTYKLKLVRDASPEDKVNNIIITGLVETVCEGHEGYCELDKEFNEEEENYSLTVPSGIRDIEFTVEKKHKYQVIVGDGVTHLLPGDNTVSIEITSEDGLHQKVYTYEIYRDTSDDNYISELIVKPIDENEEIGNEIDIGFNYLINEYAFKVGNDILGLDLDITLDDEENARIVEIRGNNNFTVGNNIVEIEIEAKNHEIRTYTLNVYRVSNDNPLLERIDVTTDEKTYSLSPEFSDVQKKYTVVVENEVQEITISGVPQKNTTTVTGDGVKNLNVGRNVYTISTTAENGLTFAYEITIIREKNSNNYLRVLEVSEGSIDPEFNKEENNYSITVEPHTKKLTINAIAESETSSVQIIGNNNFVAGLNEVIIRVTAEDLSTNDYVITVTKEVSDNNYLSSLSVKNGETELLNDFDKETESYEINVLNEVKSVRVEGIAEDSLSTVEGNNTYNLVSGRNEITIRVQSEDNNIREYTIIINREKNHNAKLRTINVSKGTLVPGFGVEEEYEVELEATEGSIVIEGIAEESTTTVSGNGEYTLERGEEKEVILTTLAEDGVTSKTYTVTIRRKQDNNTNLKTLSVDKGILKPGFNKNTTSYEVKVLNEIESINVVAEAESETSSVIITKEENLTVGENTVDILVTAEDGSTKLYSIKVIRKSVEDSSLKLRSLVVSSCNIEFNEEVKEYTCEVENEIERVTVEAEAKNNEDIVEYTSPKDLIVGENEIEVKVYDETREKENTYTVRVTRKESSETRLRNITVKNHELNEIYNKDINSYTLNTIENNLEIEYEKMHEKEEVEIIGNTNLSLGENIITIKVTAENKVDEGYYYITVTKGRNNNAYLKTLNVQGYTINFNKGTYEYNIEVENEVESIIVNAEAEEITTTVEGDGSYNILKGRNEITVTTLAEDNETSKEYTIVVTRLGSRNANLKSLEIEGYSIEFNKNTLNYEINVPYEVENVTINAEAEEENVLVSGEGIFNISVGENTRNIIVTSEHGEIKTYTVKVIRETPITSLLKNIKVRNYKLDKEFESSELNYIVVIDNEVENIVIDIEKIDPQSTYEIVGANNLEVGENEVKVISQARDNSTTTTYTLTVVRQAYSNTYLSSLSVDKGTLDPVFNKETLSYEVDVDYDDREITIDAVAENNEAIVSGTGVKNLKVGLNEFEIEVNKNGIRRKYIVKVTRDGSHNANIITITSDLGTVEKISDTKYKLIVANEVSEILSRNIQVQTEDNNATVSKQSRIDLNETKRYKIRVTAEDGITSKEYEIEINNDKNTNANLKSLSVTGYEINPGFSSDEEDYTVEILDDEEEIEVNYEVEDERSIILNESNIYRVENDPSVIEITVQSEKGNIKIYTLTVEKNLTRKKTLKKIEIEGISEVCEECNVPEYIETENNYELTVPNEVKEIDFEIEKKHRGQSYKIYKDNIEVNTYTLDVGENIFEIKVLNSFNEENVYRYTITRLPSDNTYLRSLRLVSPEKEIEDFDKEVLEYNIEVENSYENIEVEAIAEDTTSRVRISGTTYLIEGYVNDVVIKVTSESRKTREYILHVVRKPRSNNLLKTLTVSSGDIYELSPKFNSGITDYSLEISSVIESIQIEGIAEDEEAEVIGNGEYDLRIGLNKIEIKVVKETEERVYKINITRKSDKNVYLEYLRVLNGSISPEFSKKTGIYEVRIGNEYNSLNLEYAAEDSQATVEVKGNENLVYGENLVYVKVTSSDGSASKTYTLKVIKEGEGKKDLLGIKVNGELINNFDKEITEYTLEVENKVDNALIEVIRESEYEEVIGEGNHALESGETNVIDITTKAQNGETKTYTIRIYRKKNNYLMGIRLDKGELDPEFDKETSKYVVNVGNEVKEITVIGEKEDVNAEVIGNGRYSLSVGETVIPIRVINDGERIYTVKVIREGSHNTYLKYLTIGEGIMEEEYEKTREEYTVIIPNDVNKLTLDYKAEDEESTVEEIGNEEIGEEVRLRVRSTGGDVRDYILHIEKEEASYFSNKLIDLTVNRGTLSPRFDSDVLSYTVTVEGSVKKIEVGAVKESAVATVEGIGEYTLKTGRNVITIEVTSKDKKKRIYTVIVYRKNSSDARLEELEIEEGIISPEFNKNVYEYTLNISNDESYITINKIKTVEEEATYEIKDSLVLFENENNKIEIEVTASDGVTKKTYKIKLVRSRSSNNYLRSLYTSVGILSPEYDREKTMYTVGVNDSINSINIGGVPESNLASVRGLGVYNLRSGNNYANVTVVAENGEVRVYTIKIIKGADSNSYLSSLSVRGKEISPVFDKTKLDYTLEVENEEEDVIIDAEAESSKTIVKGTGIKHLEVGENIAEVIAQAEDGSIKIYTITIRRKTVVSTKIKNMWIEEGVLSPEFSSNITEYTILIPNEYREITEHVELEDALGRYVIKGNANLKVGSNKVEIEVEDSEGNKESYILNVIRQQASNTYLRSLSVNKGILSPEFNRETLNYEVRVGSAEEKINVTGIAEIESATVRGNGEYTLENEETTIIIEVESQTGVKRSYKVKVIRERSNNTYLRSLSVNGYEISPVFDKEEEEYSITTGVGVEKVTISAEAEDIKATVEGIGEVEISAGEQVKDIVVTAEDGSVKIYKLTIIRPKENNTNIIDIIPSEGVLSPTFDNTRNAYRVIVPTNINVIDIDVQLESKLSTVKGNTDIEVENNKEIIIEVEAENGSKREITITLEVEEEIKEIRTSKDVINLFKTESEEIEITNGINANEVEIINEEECISIDGLTVTGISEGTSIITIRLKSKPNIEKKVTVNVYNNEIESDVYEVVNKEKGRMIIYRNPEVKYKIEDFLIGLNNEVSTIKVYDKEDNLIEDYTEIIKTGMKIKLEYNDHTYDEATVIVKGDINEDGLINVTDQAILISHVIGKETIDDYRIYAMDLDDNEEINVTDQVELISYIITH